MLLAAAVGTAMAEDEHGMPSGTGQEVETSISHLVASDNIASLSRPKGTRARLVATHENNGVMSPTALTFDEQGNLYVSETHRYKNGIEDNRYRPFWLIDDIASSTVEDRRAMFEKWKDEFDEGHFTTRSEVIRRYTDQGDDGMFRTTEVFADDFKDALDGTAAGLFGFDGTVYLACIPNIYALRDNDDDGKAEVREVIAGGFGVKVSLSGHDLNGFTLGPDGMIYGTLGDRGMNVTTANGDEFAYPEEGVVFRFDPDGTNFEIVHRGLRNPKEIAFDIHGNAFSVDNNSDQGDKARIVYVVEGADSGWRFGHQIMSMFHRNIGMPERPVSQWNAERMWEPANPEQPAWLLPPVANLTSGPSGLTYHPGVGFTEEEVGRFLICDYRGNGARSGIWSFKVAPKGAGMKLVNARPFNWGLAVTDVEYTWDGRIMVTDFVKGWTTHEDGNVYELIADKPYRGDEAVEAARLIAEGFEERSDAELEKLLSHGDMRVRTRAHLALTRRETGFAVLERVATTGEGLSQLHAIWGLGVAARRGSAVLPKKSPDDFVDLPGTQNREKAFAVLKPLLRHGDPEVRAQAIKVLGDSGIRGDRINFGALLQDASARVRMFAAISAGKTRAVGSLSFIWSMLEANDDRDPYLRHAGVFAMEKMAHPMQLVPLRDHESAALRMAATIALGRMGHERVGEFVNDADPRVADEAIRLIHDRSIESVRHLVAEMATREIGRERTPMMWRRIIHSAFRIGDEKNLEGLIAFALNPDRPVDARREALRLLAEWNEPHPVDQLLGHYAPLESRDAKVSQAALQTKLTELTTIDPALIGDALLIVKRHGLDVDQVPDQALREVVTNGELQDDGRLRALEMYAARNPEGFDDFLLGLTRSSSQALAYQGLVRLQKRGSDRALDGLLTLMDSDRLPMRQIAWKAAADFDDEKVVGRIVAGLIKLAEAEGEAGDALELLEAAKARKEDAVVQALAAYDQAIAASEDPLAMWKPALSGGDASEGYKLFASHPAAQCARCHAGGDDQAGPKLDGIASRTDRRYLLESLVLPGAQVTPGYGVVVATLKNGDSLGGVLLAEDGDSVRIDVAGEEKTIPRSEIKELSTPVSAMPPMAGILKTEELRDLVEWLANQK
ncbi:MAG: HEAT repeat domain-containing protein [Verrucomicrobiota bacterium]